jgi:predicted dienelactone hydrolase
VKRKIVLALILAFSSVSFGADQAGHVNVQGRDVALWKPSGSAPKTGYPLIVFSHGFGGCNTQSRFLMEALAQAGYLVVAPNHADARCGTRPRTGMIGRRPEEPFQKPKQWSEATYRDRHDDIVAVLDAVLADKKFQGIPVDPRHIGIAGHSLGGYTALGVGGGWPSWRDDRIKAVLALSAFCTPYTAKGDLKHLGVPVMYQGGTRDFGVTPTIRRFSGAYDLSSSPKYYVEFDDAGHFAWTNLNPNFQPIIVRYSIAFMDYYLKVNSRDRLTPLLGTPPPPGVSYLKYDDPDRAATRHLSPSDISTEP